MAINANHPFEDIEGVKCAVVEKNVSPERTGFLKELLEFNGYTVIVTGAANPKAVPAGEGETEAAPPPPTSFTVGVTDVMFNATNAVFGRLLRTPQGKVVTLGYWKQLTAESNDQVPYFQR